MDIPAHHHPLYRVVSDVNGNANATQHPICVLETPSDRVEPPVDSSATNKTSHPPARPVSVSFFSTSCRSVSKSIEPNGELGFTMVFQSKMTPFKRWVEPERIQKYVNFFGPGVDAEVREGEWKQKAGSLA